MSLIDIDKVIDAIGKTGLDLGVKTELMTKVLNIPIEGAWHYPSRGEYPTEGEEVWVSWSSNGDYGVEKFYHNKNGEEVWGMKLSPPYAWQHIIPPKEEA